MRNKNFIILIVFAVLFLTGTLSQAGAPVWTFTPLTATTISVPTNGTATVQYQVTNQSSRSHTLAMNAIHGVAQITSGAGICGNPFVLSGHRSCTLSLQINGAQAQAGNTNGPVVCEQDSPLQCYRPNATDTLKVNRTEGQYTIGGSLSGLTNTVYLQNNGIDLTAFSNNGSFTFPTPLMNGISYNVTVAAQPTNQTCSVVNGTGAINGSNVTNVAVTCSTNAYTVGGTVSGLSGTVILLNGTDADTVTSNGPFTFAIPVAEGSAYNVTVGRQPSGQTCTVTNASGTMGGSNVTNVNVSCAANSTTLSTSLSNLALATNGNARVITITNTGSNTAENLSISYPTWPSGTTASSTCGSSLNATDTCTVTVTPGAGATSSCNTNGTAPTPGTMTVSATNVATAVTSQIVVLAYGCQYQGGFIYSIDDTTANTSSISGKVTSLVDQAAPFINSGSQATSIIWSSNGNGSVSADVDFTAILGIAETSTTLSPSPTAPSYPAGTPAYTACNGALDGACDSSNILSYYNFNRSSGGSAPTPVTYYAAGLCTATINGYSDWYLPAICEMDGAGSFATCPAGMQNMKANLVFLIGDPAAGTPSTSCSPPSGTDCLAGLYWGSTEASTNPRTFAWHELFTTSGSFAASNDSKSLPFGVRCSRVLTP